MNKLRLIFQQRPFWRLLRLVWPQRKQIALAVILGFATIGSSVGLMATSAFIIAKAALHPSIADLQVAVVGVRFFGISRGVFRYLERYVSHHLTFNLLARFRVWLYERLEPLAPARLMQYRSGDLLTRIVADIESLEHFYVRVIAPPLIAVLVAGLVWVLLAGFGVTLAMVTLAFLLVAGVGLPLLTQTLSRGFGRQLVATRAELNALLIDGIQGGADLLTHNRDAVHRAQVARLSEHLSHLQERMAWITGLNAALSGLLTNWSTIALLILAIPMVRQGQFEGVFLAVIVLAAMAGFEAVINLPDTLQHLEESTSAAGRLFELVDAEPAVADPVAPSPQPAGYHLQVENLHFRYVENEAWALRDVSFTLNPGQRLAIVGPSGAGKSSLINVLLRFWDYQQGDVQLGGHDLRAYHAADLRRLISVVSQHTHLFNGTIRDNLLVANPEADEAALIEAARQAQLHHFIQQLPEGYDTWIGEQGLRLSGGERQRLAIARALLQDAPILILDEATANLDPLVERKLMQALEILMADRTTLIITHRLVGLENVDHILVLRHGQVVEQGRQHELLHADGLYRGMWELQRQLHLNPPDTAPA